MGFESERHGITEYGEKTKQLLLYRGLPHSPIAASTMQRFLVSDALQPHLAQYSRCLRGNLEKKTHSVDPAL